MDSARGLTAPLGHSAKLLSSRRSTLGEYHISSTGVFKGVLTRCRQCGLRFRFVFLCSSARDMIDSCVQPCRYPAWGVSCVSETMGTGWSMGWLDRQFGVLVLGSHDCLGEEQLEERRG